MNSKWWKSPIETKIINPARNVLTFVYWNINVKLLANYFKKGNIICRYWHAWSKELMKNTILLDYHGAPCHKLIPTIAKLHKLYLELLPIHFISQICSQPLESVGDLNNWSRENSLTLIKKCCRKWNLRSKLNYSTKKLLKF